MENTTILDPVPVVERQGKRVVGKDEHLNPPVIPISKSSANIFIKIAILTASVFLMIATCLLIACLHVYKVFRKFKMPDPFHDSRKHPLNDPHAARG